MKIGELLTLLPTHNLKMTFSRLKRKARRIGLAPYEIEGCDGSMEKLLALIEQTKLRDFKKKKQNGTKHSNSRSTTSES